MPETGGDVLEEGRLAGKAGDAVEALVGGGLVEGAVGGDVGAKLNVIKDLVELLFHPCATGI